VTVNETSADTATITNTGSGPASIAGVEITGPQADAFTITDSGGLPGTIEAGESADIGVEFTPSTEGKQAATLALDTGNSTVAISLEGTGQGPVLAASGGLRFGDVGVSNAAVDSVTVENRGTTELDFADVSIVDDSDGVFEVVNAPATLPAGESAKIDVRFEPTGDGSYDAELAIESNDPVTPTRRLDVDGSGVGPTIAVSRQTLNFGEVEVGETVTIDITVENHADSPAPLTVDSMVITGKNPDAFAVSSGDAPFTLAPGESTQVEVAFSPQETGTKDAQLQLLSNAGNQRQIDVWLTNSRTYIVVQETESTAETNETTNGPAVNVDANNVQPKSDLVVNVSRQATKEAPAGFDELEMTVKNGGYFEMNLTHTGTAPEGKAVYTSEDTQALQYTQLDHSISNSEFDNTAITYRVRKDTLPSGATPEEVSFNRFSEGEWNTLTATHLRSTETHHVYKVQTPGFSQFVISAPDAATQQTDTDDDSGSTTDSDETDPGGETPSEQTVDDSVADEGTGDDSETDDGGTSLLLKGLVVVMLVVIAVLIGAVWRRRDE
jgi:nitrogen fixation protein FixH